MMHRLECAAAPPATPCLPWGLLAGGGAGTASQPAAGQAAPQPTLTPAQQYQVVLSTMQQATSQVQLPPSRPQFGPDPAGNEWNMLAVGLPIWFWTADQPDVDASRTANGIAIQLTAHRAATTFDFGDGTRLTCTTMTRRPDSAEPLAKSPDCGHVYREHGTYTITATTTWHLRWSALGFGGTETTSRAASATVTVGQLASVVVK